MGLAGRDHQLPPSDAEAPSREAAELGALIRRAEEVEVADTAGARVEARMLRAALAHARAALDHWSRYRQPSWYTGEVAFGLVSLLLPSAPAAAREALPARLAAIPKFLAGAPHHLAGQPTPADWVERALKEVAALGRLFVHGLPRHPLWRAEWRPTVDAAGAALRQLAESLSPSRAAPVACGRDYLAFLMRDVHGLSWTPEEAVAFAEDGFARLGDRLASEAQRIDPTKPWQEQLSELSAVHPDLDDVAATYRRWHERALEEAGKLMTPAAGYGLDFLVHEPWAQPVIGDLYFLAYRSPPALTAGRGSVYWIPAPGADAAAYLRSQATVTVKQTHAVHHGSIGHHTQNARAREAPSRLARLAGTDCASGIAFLSSGTMVEGWACYATELMAEVEGFYTPAEKLALIQADRRNAASVLADIKLHTGAWSLEQMRAFYRDEAGFPAARVWGETTRNSLLPATRVMYFLGTEQIKALRREIGGEPKPLFDALLGHGHVPIAWAAEEIRRT
ncbi:MAG: DUF885 domain-containing protein [Alphaproteobacteria bacterium]|nr:DUF885 domain-containing protein [Alphaproteobacteria bacterium]